jgi:A/G-specific adenine glycosylase
MSFGARVLDWYARNRRDLPWRRTKDQYAILLSEVMLQQTQVARVVPVYERFRTRFPTLLALAHAGLRDVLREWRGLGYNRRARDLHRIARAHPSGLPTTLDALDALPGIGAYTAAAVACFSFGQQVPLADTNIRRVLGRVFLGRIASEREARRLDQALLPPSRAADWHHALMDLGATICSSRAPRCAACPVRADCLSRGRARISSGRRATPFAASDRRLRGRIVSRLSDADGWLSLRTLSAELRDSRLGRLVRALEAEGLVECEGGRARLPA